MKGYVVNISNTWMHAMKRAVSPGAKIPLSELYNQYGVKHNIEEGKPFVSWLEEVKLRDSNKWRVVLDEEIDDKKQLEVEKEVPHNKDDLTIDDIIGLSVRKARDLLPQVTNIKLLKQSIIQANQLAGKDSLCKEIRKRIRQLQSVGAA